MQEEIRSSTEQVSRKLKYLYIDSLGDTKELPGVEKVVSMSGIKSIILPTIYDNENHFDDIRKFKRRFNRFVASCPDDSP